MTTPAPEDRTRRAFALDDAVAILKRTPATVDAMLRGLPAAWVTANEGGDTWSPFDVVGHLIHGERTDWLPRARHILEHGDARPFDTFDRFAQFDASRGRSLDSLLDEFAAARRKTWTVSRRCVSPTPTWIAAAGTRSSGR